MRTPDDPTSTRQKRICEQVRVESKSVPVFVPATVPVRTETPANIVFMGKRAGEGNRTLWCIVDEQRFTDLLDD